jgi:hypothetical protein
VLIESVNTIVTSDPSGTSKVLGTLGAAAVGVDLDATVVGAAALGALLGTSVVGAYLGTSVVDAAAAPGEGFVSSTGPVEHPLNPTVNTITKIVVHKFFMGSPSQ